MERPILFSTLMVQAILAGRKTQTRRLMVCQSGKWKGKQPIDVLPMNTPGEWVGLMQKEPNQGSVFKCRFGQIGDKLWVRETYVGILDQENKNRYYYKANSEDEEYIRKLGGIKWRPSIFLPRWASRITLVITDVRVQRLQEISHADITAEGLGDGYTEIGWNYTFGQLWNSINEKKGHGWSTNPFVWAITFKKEAK